MTKAQAYNDLVNKANKNFNCALPAIAVGAIIGFFVSSWAGSSVA